MLLQPPDARASAAAAAASATSKGDAKHVEENSNQEAAAVDAVADGRELTALPASDVCLLQPFEVEDGEDSCQGEEVSQVAERLKDRGNTLFKLGDTDAAAEMFTRVLRTLEPKPVAGGARATGGGCDAVKESRLLLYLRFKLPIPTSATLRSSWCCRQHSSPPPRARKKRCPPRITYSVAAPLRSPCRLALHLNAVSANPLPKNIPPTGATVLVRLAPSDAASATRFRSGMIADADDNGGSPTYDVIYDEAENTADQQGAGAGQEEEDEEDGVAADRVLGVPASLCVWCAARLNLARCSFRRGRHAEVRTRKRRRSGRRSMVGRMIPLRGAWVVFGAVMGVVFSCRLALGVGPCCYCRAFWPSYSVQQTVFPPPLSECPSFSNPQLQRATVFSEIHTYTDGYLQVVEACTLVLVVARLTMAEKERPRAERAKLRNHCLTALRLRGGSHLAQHHVGLARKDARCVRRFLQLLPKFRFLRGVPDTPPSVLTSPKSRLRMRFRRLRAVHRVLSSNQQQS